MKAVINIQSGFTLIEILVTLALSAVTLAASYSAYLYQQRIHVTQNQLVDMHQNVRNALYIMENDIRMAGYDATGDAKSGFVEAFPIPHSGIGPAAESTYIAFTVDDDEDGGIDDNTTELVAYQYNPNDETIERFTTVPGSGSVDWEVVADNIDALDFIYLDGDNQVLPAPVANPEEIRSIQVTIVARSGKEVPAMMMSSTDNTTYWNQQGEIILGATGDKFRRMRNSVEIQCRNLALQH